MKTKTLTLICSCLLLTACTDCPDSCVAQQLQDAYDLREMRKFELAESCAAEFANLPQAKIEQLEQCDTDINCQNLSIAFGISPICAEY